MTITATQLKIAERKKVIVKRIDKLEEFILEENTPALAKKAFEINLKHLREEYRKLEILEKDIPHLPQ